MNKWPKLSEDLQHTPSPGHCQSCGSSEELQCWMEHGDNDEPTDTKIIICRECDHVIEPHPRLYTLLPYNGPRPGAMRCCTACLLREGLQCKHPQLKSNGGEGLPIQCSQPQVTFVDGERNGKKFGYQHVFYTSAPVCTGRRP